jgi:acyl carrier protein
MKRAVHGVRKDGCPPLMGILRFAIGPSCVPRAVSAAQLQLLPGDRGVPLRPLCPVWLRPNPVAPGCSTGAVHTRPKGTKLTALSPQRSEREPARAARNVMKRVGVFRRESCRFLRATVVLLQHFNNFERKPHCRADCLVCYLAHSGHRGLAMSIVGLTSTEQTTAIKAVFAANDVRALIANHLGVSVGRVTDEAHFTDDLGADWLDRLELMIAFEDQFVGVQITADDVDRIELVGDLIRHIETLDSDRRPRDAAVLRNLFRPHVARAMKPTKQQERCDEAALFFLGFAGNAMRSLTGWCRETRQPVDLQLYVDDATLARIWSNALRFQCPHCGTKHETEVQRLASKPFSLEPRNARGISTPRGSVVQSR